MIASSQPSPLVLIVEDHADTRALVTLWFEQCGCRVMEAATGVDALKCVREHRPDAIITDIGLPGAIDGLEFCRQIRGNPATQAIPLIAVTGWARPDLVERAQQAGCRRVLVKPCSPTELLHELCASFRVGPACSTLASWRPALATGG